jgi:hypothetical protein
LAIESPVVTPEVSAAESTVTDHSTVSIKEAGQSPEPKLSSLISKSSECKPEPILSEVRKPITALKKERQLYGEV